MINSYTHKALLTLFAIVFCYSIFTMSIAREVIIPRMAESKDGHIAGDPEYYHTLAQKKVVQIRHEGFMAFELRPAAQGPAGVASILYYAWDSPYAVVLLNALLHALSVCIMVLILCNWFSINIALYATIPLALSPYMMFWFSQLNKDSFALSGALLFIYGLTKITTFKKNDHVENLLTKKVYAFLLTVAGITLIWIARPYVNQISLPIVAVTAISLVFFSRSLTARVGKYSCWFSALMLFLVLACLSFMGKGSESDATLRSLERPFTWQSLTGGQPLSLADRCLLKIDSNHWKNSSLLPSFVNAKLKALMGQRCLTFTLLETQKNHTTLNSFVDTDILPSSSIEAIVYLPHAALLGIFAPWPDRWNHVFKHKISVFYSIVPIEAVMLYIGIVCIVIWVYQNRVCSIMLPVLVSVFIMTVFGMATPFIGTLYRYRYPWWMLLICLGLASLIDIAYRSRRCEDNKVSTYDQ